MEIAADGRLKLVLHPRHGPGLLEALQALDGIQVITPDDPADVADCLDEAPALITFDWYDRYLSPGLGWVQAISAEFDYIARAFLGEHGWKNRVV